MWDEMFNLIYSWGHRYWLEIGLTFVFFLLIHFIGYPLVIRRHEATSKTTPVTTSSPTAPSSSPATITIHTGDITTHGNNSGVSVGVSSEAKPDTTKKPKP
jgi:hypothetical protein